MIPTFHPNDPAPADSTYVYGQNDVANSTLVVALALRRQRSFSWADCSLPTTDTPARRGEPYARGVSRPKNATVSEEDLVVPHWSADTLERLLVPETRLDSLHLLSYLSLPSLLQELAALSTSPTGESIVFLANVDALDPRLRASVLGEAVVHSRLHSEAVSLFVTSRGRPTPTEETLFDHVFRLEVPSAGTWSEGSLQVDKGSRGPGVRSLPIREAWESMGLDPTLLPPSGDRPRSPAGDGAGDGPGDGAGEEPRSRATPRDAPEDN